MASTGLLIVSNVKHFGKSLRAIEKYVKALYVHLNIPESKTQPVPSWGRMISQLYVDSNCHWSNGVTVDMRILVGPIKRQDLAGLQLRHIDMIFSDAHHPEVCAKLSKQLHITSNPIYLEEASESDIESFQSAGEANKMYETVVLGGTFDRIHLGHKIFLTTAVLRACRRLVVGVTTADMNKSKTLCELILPVEERIREIREFLMEVDANIQYDIVPIDDPFGPTQTDPNMDLIVVSKETLRGGHKVNEVRTKKNLRPLEIFCIDLVECEVEEGPKESKISSSNARIDLLGTRLRQPEPRPHLCSEPYIIGLTGGIASGKSKMAQRFADKGAQILDCDKIAHDIYEPGKDCFHKVVKHFGKDVLDANGRINRAKVGQIVFSDPQQLVALNNIVWPELMEEVKRRIRDLHDKHQCQVVVIEAAVLLKAGWESECHEVWTTMVPRELAVKRIIERNGLSEEEARKRLASQLENSEMVARSHVVFSTQWDDACTQQQADKAWQMLMHDLDERKRQHNTAGATSSRL